MKTTFSHSEPVEEKPALERLAKKKKKHAQKQQMWDKMSHGASVIFKGVGSVEKTVMFGPQMIFMRAERTGQAA